MKIGAQSPSRRPRSRVNDIVLGPRGITADAALHLARYFGLTPEVWINLQARYDFDVAERTLHRRIEEEVRSSALADRAQNRHASDLTKNPDIESSSGKRQVRASTECRRNVLLAAASATAFSPLRQTRRQLALCLSKPPPCNFGIIRTTR
jgi:plasmid maintenance system antidote protein VapI